MTDIGWGIVSTGRIADSFAKDFKTVTGGRIIGATSRTLANAESFVDRHNIPRVYGSYHDMLDDPTIDAVYIATPHTLHVQNTLDAVHAGKAVLCEKPAAVSPIEFEAVTATSNSRSSFVMEAMWTWFLPAFRKAAEWVEAGRIGKLIHIKADFGFPMRPYSPDTRVYDARLGGGCLLDMGIYPIALLWRFLRRAPESLNAVARFAPNGVEDDLSVLLDYGDCTAAIATTFRAKLPNWAYLIGEDGHIAIPDFWQARECLHFELDNLCEHYVDDRRTIGLNFEIQATIEDIQNGKTESDVVTLNDSMQFQRTIQQIRDSMPKQSLSTDY